MRLSILAAVVVLCLLPLSPARAQAVPTASIDLVRPTLAVGAANGGQVTLANKVPGESYTIELELLNSLLAFQPDCSDASNNGNAKTVAENDYVVFYACGRGDSGYRLHTTNTSSRRVVSDPLTNLHILNSPGAPPVPSVDWNSGVNPGNSYLYSMKFNLTNTGDEWTGPVIIPMGTGLLRDGGYLDSNANNMTITDGAQRRIPGSLIRLPNAQKRLVAYTTVSSGASDLYMYTGGTNGANSATITSGLGGQVSSLGLIRYTQNLEIVFDVRIDSFTPGWEYLWRGAGFDIIPTGITDGLINARFRVTTTGVTTGFTLSRSRFHRIAIVQTTDRFNVFIDGKLLRNFSAPAAFARSAQPKNVNPWRSDENGIIYAMRGSIEGGIGPIRIRDTVANTTIGEWVFKGQSTVINKTFDGERTNVADTWAGSTPNNIRGGPAFTWQFKTRPHPDIDLQTVTIDPIGVTDRGDIAVRSTDSGGSTSDAPDTLGLTEDSTGLFGMLGPLREGATRSAGGTAWLVMAALVSIGIGGRVMRASNSMLAAAGAGILVFAIGAVALGIPLVWTVVISISLVSSSLIYAHAR